MVITVVNQQEFVLTVEKKNLCVILDSGKWVAVRFVINHGVKTADKTAL